jgi:hypothetical protein
MKVSVSKIILNDNVPVMPFMEATVSFFDEFHVPHQSIEVSLHLDKNPNLTLNEIRTLAIQKGYDFLSLALSARP